MPGLVIFRVAPIMRRVDFLPESCRLTSIELFLRVFSLLRPEVCDLAYVL